MNPTITIHQVDPKGPSVTVMLGEGFAVPTVTGGWQPTPRPRARAISEWQGQDLALLDIPIMLDGLADSISVEPQARQLFDYMRGIVGPRSEPPVLKITGVPIPFANLEWVLNSITPGEEVRRHSDGKRIRAAMSLQFLEHREGDVVVSRTTSPAKKHQQKQTEHWTAVPVATATKTYIVKKGDTLQKIAAHELGSANRWHDIASLNDIRDPSNIKVGQKLKLPKQ